MKPIHSTCQPRDEVLKGELREQEFAASLTKVIRGDAESVYADPIAFFANTFPTNGLTSVLRESLGRITGSNPTNASVIRLETSFGGGKTHSLIALYHVCKSGQRLKSALKFLPAELIPSKPIEKVAGVVGPDMSVSEPTQHGKIRTHTIWGE